MKLFRFKQCMLFSSLRVYFHPSFLILMFLITTNASFSQERCGTQALTTQQLDEILGNIAQLSRQNIAKARTTYNIPLQFVIVNDNNGNSPLSSSTNLLDVVAEINSGFTNDMEFYLCGITEVNSSTYHNLTVSGTNQTGLYNLFHVNDAINIYIVNTMFNTSGNPIGGFAAINGSINRIFTTGGGTGGTVTHELGHHFSLLHTHTSLPGGGIPLPSQPCLGDGICDTPVDPGIDFCDENVCTVSPCTVNGFTYSPDRQNIMSYYTDFCGNSFSPTQLTIMQNNLLTEPNKAYLLTPPTSCVPFIIADEGKVEKVKNITGTSVVSIRLAEVFLTEAGSTCSIETDGGSPNYNYHYRPSDCGYITPDNVTIQVKPQRDTTAQWDNATFLGDNGVSTFDQLEVQKHILGINTLGSPYPKIAADVNRSGSITSFDIVLIQKVILGIDPTFSVTESWQYIPSHYLENSSFKTSFDANPFTAIYNSSKTYNGTTSYLNDIDIDLSDPVASNNTTWSFKAVKMGDVDFSSTLHNQTTSFREQVQAESRNNTDDDISQYIESLENCLKEGEEFTIEIIGENQSDIAAYQLGFSFDKESLAISKVQKSNFGDFSLDNFGLTKLDKGELRTNWVNKKGINLKVNNNNRKLFKLRLVALKEICNLEGVIKLDNNVLENFFLDENGERVKGQIVFETKSTGNKKEKLRVSNNKLLKIYPNPSNSSSDLTFEVQLEKKQKVQIIVNDQFGNRISKETFFNNGVNQTSLNNAKNLHPGPLFYKIIIGKEIINGTIIKH